MVELFVGRKKKIRVSLFGNDAGVAELPEREPLGAERPPVCALFAGVISGGSALHTQPGRKRVAERHVADEPVVKLAVGVFVDREIRVVVVIIVPAVLLPVFQAAHPVVFHRLQLHRGRQPAVEQVHDALGAVADRRAVAAFALDVAHVGIGRKLRREIIPTTERGGVAFQVGVGHNAGLVEQRVRQPEVARVVAARHGHVGGAGTSRLQKFGQVVGFRCPNGGRNHATRRGVEVAAPKRNGLAVEGARRVVLRKQARKRKGRAAGLLGKRRSPGFVGTVSQARARPVHIGKRAVVGVALPINGLVIRQFQWCFHGLIGVYFHPDALVAAPRFGFNHNNAVGRPRPIQGRGRAAFQHVDALNIVGVNETGPVAEVNFQVAPPRPAREAVGNRYAVDDVERLVFVEINRPFAPNGNPRRAANARRATHHRNARHLARQLVGHVGFAGNGKGGTLHLLRGVAEGFFLAADT